MYSGTLYAVIDIISYISNDEIQASEVAAAAAVVVVTKSHHSIGCRLDLG
jgi:hypothetical protein